MKIFEKDGWVHLQLMDMTTREMLFDFAVAKEHYDTLKEHIIEHLNEFEVSK